MLNNCKVQAHIYEEGGDSDSSAPVATVVCRNGLHIEHVSSGVSRDRKALLRNVVRRRPPLAHSHLYPRSE